MKQMSLIEMDGFLKGKCIPRDLKVNETNAEYLVRKFGELESKIALLEVQLKLSEAAERAWESSMMQACGEDGPKSVADKFAELEAKCAALATDNEKAMEAIRQADAAVKLAHEKFSALAAKINVINELMKVAEQVNKLAQEETEKLAHERNTLAAENAGLKAVCEDRRTFIMNGVQLGYIQVPTVETDPALETIRVAVSPQEPTPATDAFLAEVRAQAHKEGAHFVANRMLAAWEAGFIDDTAKNAADIARMILTSTEFMADAPEGDYDRSLADGVLEDIAAQLRKGVQS